MSELFVIKHYTSDDHPTLKGNGFDGLIIGEDREEAEEFVAYVNQLQAQLAAAHTLIHQIEDDIKFTGSEINVRKSINNYRAAIKGDES